MAGVAIKNLTRCATAPQEFFEKVSREVLPRFDISLAFVGPTRARALNIQLRGKDYVPNVLSYALGKDSGEIIICLSEARKQAKSYEMSADDFILYLFIHGLLHIKGWAHGVTMEVCERKLLAKYATGGGRSLPNEPTNRDRNRHRHAPGKNGGSRGARR